jgi:hypothetical protein
MKTRQSIFPLATLLLLLALLVPLTLSASDPAVPIPTGGTTIRFTEHEIDYAFGGAYDVYYGDLDGDQDIDAVGAAYEADEIAWWENDGTPAQGAWTKYTIETGFWGANSLYAVDLDDDEDVDVLALAAIIHDIAWWENDGTPLDGGWTKHIIHDDFAFANAVYPVDLDDDGDMDILAAGGSITWWESDGTPGDGGWTEHLIGDDFTFSESVYASDLDGDDDVDVLAVTQYGDDVIWWENDGSPWDGGWVAYSIDDNFNRGRSVTAADLDGDTDTDVIGAAYDGDEIAWWENDGTPGNGGWTKHTILGGYTGARSVYVVDFDSDGHMDILSTARYENDISLWQNDGTPADGGWTRQVVTNSFDGASHACATDLDGDGDGDILGAAYEEDQIAWWEPSAPLQAQYLPLVFKKYVGGEEPGIVPEPGTWNCSPASGATVRFTVSEDSQSVSDGLMSNTACGSKSIAGPVPIEDNHFSLLHSDEVSFISATFDDVDHATGSYGIIVGDCWELSQMSCTH